jgi:hypothetical protein
MYVAESMAELIIQPLNKGGGRSVSISEERQFGVSAIYRSGYVCHLYQYSIQVSLHYKERRFWVSALYSSGYTPFTLNRSISIREERQFEVSTTYRSGYTHFYLLFTLQKEQGSAIHLTNMVWLYRSPILVGRRFVLYFTC